MKKTSLGLVAVACLAGCASVESTLPGEWATDMSLSSLGDLKGDAAKFPSITLDKGGTCHLMAVDCTWTVEKETVYVKIEKGDKLMDFIGAEKGRSAEETKLTVVNGGKNLQWMLSREKGEPLKVVLKKVAEAHEH